MNLRSDTRQNVQLTLDFRSTPTGEAQKAETEAVEAGQAVYSDVFLQQIRPRPDLILVPTFSISRRSSPRVARSLWRSMAIARAYEFSPYVGISDWAYPCEYHGLRSSSVAGLADPRPLNGSGFFAIGDSSFVTHVIDLPRLRELRRYRNEHAFLSDETLVGDQGTRQNRSILHAKADMKSQCFSRKTLR